MKEGAGSWITGNRTSRKESTTMKIGKISHTYRYRQGQFTTLDHWHLELDYLIWSWLIPMCDSHNQDPNKHQSIEHPHSSIEAVDETLNVAYHHPQWGNRTLNEEVQYIIALPNFTFHCNIWICMYKASLIPKLSFIYSTKRLGMKTALSFKVSYSNLHEEVLQAWVSCMFCGPH